METLLINKISELVRPFLPEQKGQVFFKAFAAIEESEVGKHAKNVYGNKPGNNLVISRGVIIDTEYGNHQVLYEHSHRTATNSTYKTILGRPFSELSEKELNNIHSALSDNIVKNKVFPALINENYDEEIGEEDHTYFSVKFDKPFDEEQISTADAHECETINPEKGEYLFMEYDDAIGFAFDNTINLESRNNIRRVVVDDKNIYFNVTIETDDTRLEDLADRHNGGVDFTNNGTPLVIAGFTVLADARAYLAEVRKLVESDAKQAIHDRIVTPSARRFTPEQIQTMNRYSSMFAKESSAEETFKRLFDSVSQEKDVLGKPEKWKSATLSELSDIAHGKTFERQQELKI